MAITYSTFLAMVNSLRALNAPMDTWSSILAEVGMVSIYKLRLESIHN